MNQERQTSTVVPSLCIGLLLLNFGFDWWRRYDFTKDKHNVEGIVAETEDRLHVLSVATQKATSASGEFYDASREHLEYLDALFDDLLSREFSEMVDLRSSAQTPIVDPAIDSVSTDGIVAPAQLEDVLGMPLAEILEFRDAFKEDPFIAQHYSKLLTTEAWDSSQIVAALEEAYGPVGEANRRMILQCKVEAWRGLSDGLYKEYKLKRNEALVERIKNGDFDSRNEKGVFTDTSGRNDVADEVFSVSLLGPMKISWRAKQYPEIYRLNMLNQQIPVMMLDDVRTYVAGSQE